MTQVVNWCILYFQKAHVSLLQDFTVDVITEYKPIITAQETSAAVSSEIGFDVLYTGDRDCWLSETAVAPVNVYQRYLNIIYYFGWSSDIHVLYNALRASDT